MTTLSGASLDWRLSFTWEIRCCGTEMQTEWRIRSKFVFRCSTSDYWTLRFDYLGPCGYLPVRAASTFCGWHLMTCFVRRFRHRESAALFCRFGVGCLARCAKCARLASK